MLIFYSVTLTVVLTIAVYAAAQTKTAPNQQGITYCGQFPVEFLIIFSAFQRYLSCLLVIPKMISLLMNRLDQ